MTAPAPARGRGGRLLLLLALAACDSVTGARPPEVVSAELAGSGPLARTLTVELARPDPLVVDYWTEGAPRLRVRSPRAVKHTLPLARLRAGRTYTWRIAGSDREGTFGTAPLPADLAQVRLAATGTPTTPLVLLHLYRADGFRGYVVVDGAGEVVWYWRGQGVPYGMTRRRNGNFVFLDQLRGLVEVTPAGTVVRELAQDVAGRGEMHHDVIATPSNTLLVIAFDRRTADGAPLLGDAVWEWSPEAGTVVKRWSAWDHFSPQRDRGPRFDREWLHANALALGPRQNVLLSIHYWNQVISISPGWGPVEWRLGGVNATIPLAPGEQFTGQHTAREIAPGRVVLFDNRHEQGGSSRAVEFDLFGGVARRVWEWRPPRANFASVVSSARRLPGGNTLVGFGTSAGLAGGSGPIEVYEVTPAGEPVWHLGVDGPLVMYRAEPLSTLAGEEVVEGPP
ncbi:MAG TPA: aryl-sulfate sulfotransferase [Longimicrobiaceae bacterium]|nr:aryl-sulfate sulfotransferase [Longimicrobiaceae bacterium]